MAVALAVLAIAVLMFAITRMRLDNAAGAADAAGYTPPVLKTPSVVTNAGGSGTRVTVIGDDLSVGPNGQANALWTTLLQRNLGATVTTLASDGAGYTVSPKYGASRTFVDAAEETVSNSAAVVMFGGANDAGAPTLEFVKAGTQAVSTVRGLAPKATVFIIGPVWANNKPPAAVLAVRDSLRTVASVTGATFVDPIQRGWLDRAGLLSSDGVTLSTRGQTVLADRVTALVKPALR